MLALREGAERGWSCRNDVVAIRDLGRRRMKSSGMFGLPVGDFPELVFIAQSEPS